jgi:hypothetical protein
VAVNVFILCFLLLYFTLDCSRLYLYTVVSDHARVLCYMGYPMYHVLYSMVFFHVRLFETVFSCFTSKASIKRQVLLVSFHFLFSGVSGRDQKCIGVSIGHQW